MVKIKNLLSMEIQHSAANRLTPTGDLNEELYKIRVLEGDLRKAEAALLSEPTTDLLQAVKTWLRRGFFDRAQEILRTLEREQTDSGVLSEIYLELARLTAFEGHWEQVETLTQRAFSHQPPAVSQMTLHQVAAVAFLELGDGPRAQREIDRAFSFTRLLPGGSLPFYIEATQMKLWMHQGESTRAESRLVQAWRQLKSSPELNFDHCLLLIRTQSELRRLRGQTSADGSFAAWLLARATGDDLYQALAVLELFPALAENQQSAWRAELTRGVSAFQRVRRLRTEFLGGQDLVSASAKGLAKIQVEEAFALTPAKAESFRQVLLLRQSLLLNLETREVTSIKLTEQMIAALQAVSKQGLTKAEFFGTLWGSQKFASHLHDPAIRSLLHRIRSTTGIAIETHQGLIELPGTFVVDL